MVVALCLEVMPTHATEPTPTQGEQAAQLFDEGIRLRNKGRFQEGCAKFRQSHALRLNAGTMLNVASCHEVEGDVAGALELVESALALAVREPDSEKSQIWMEMARDEIAALEPRVVKLTVRSAAAAPPAAMLDGKPLLQWNTALRLNPGRHELEAAAPRRKPFVRTLELSAGQSETLVVPELEEEATPPPASEAQPGSLPVPLEAVPPLSSPSQASAWVSYSLLAVGSVAFAGGAITGLVARKMTSDLERDCPGRVCEGGLSPRDRAQDTALVADVLMGTGLVAGAVGITLLLTAADEAAPASVAWGCGPGGCAASWRGSF